MTELPSPLFARATIQSGYVAFKFTKVSVRTSFTVIKEGAGNCFFWPVDMPRVINMSFTSRCSSAADSKHTTSLTIFRLSSERGLLLRTT